MASILVPPPRCFGIFTARTAGGKYVPDDIRFLTLNKLFFRSGSKFSDGLAIHPGSTLIRLHLPGLPDLHFEMSR